MQTNRKEELLSELLREYKEPGDILGAGGLLTELTKRLVEKALEKEKEYHLGYVKGVGVHRAGGGNRRNGSSTKEVRSEQGVMWSCAS